MKCPHCGGEIVIQVQSGVSETKEYIISQFFAFLNGYRTHKSEFQVTDKNCYSFYVQTYDSPEGDIWARGTISWHPGQVVPEVVYNWEEKEKPEVAGVKPDLVCFANPPQEG